MGFRYVASGPMVRSSYKAGELFVEAMMDDDAERARLAAQLDSFKARKIELGRELGQGEASRGPDWQGRERLARHAVSERR